MLESYNIKMYIFSCCEFGEVCKMTVSLLMHFMVSSVKQVNEEELIVLYIPVDRIMCRLHIILYAGILSIVLSVTLNRYGP